jgi:hypothetical protein
LTFGGNMGLRFGRVLVIHVGRLLDAVVSLECQFGDLHPVLFGGYADVVAICDAGTTSHPQYYLISKDTLVLRMLL